MSWQGRLFDFIYKFRSSGRLTASAFSGGGKSSVPALDPQKKIVVVGLGLSSLTLLEQLHQAGYRHIQVVAENLLFGGKCVHFGCIPSEIFWQDSKKIPGIVKQIQQLSEEKFRHWGYPLLLDSVKAVEGRQIRLASGKILDFDVLVLATGNRSVPPQDLQPSLAPENFWSLQTGRQLLILSEGEPTAWSYADMALEMGLTCTLVETKGSAIEDTPSFAYFRRQIRKRGLRDFPAAKVVSFSAAEKKLAVRSGGSHHEIPYDDFIYLGPPQLNLPAIDGVVPDIFALDLENSRLKKRSDIFTLGDAGGFLTAAEAELKALKLAWQLSGRQNQIELPDLARLPLRLHAQQSWASVGHPLTYLAKHWREVDFKNLGWSLIHEGEGKLWYLFNPGTRKIEALHLCHSQASELIGLAASLIRLPVTDPLWLTASVHPSAAEIFKILVLELRRDFPEVFPGDGETKTVLRLPGLASLRPRFAEFFSEKEFQSVQLDKDPWFSLAQLLLRKYTGDDKAENFSCTYDSAAGLLTARHGNKSYEVQRL